MSGEIRVSKSKRQPLERPIRDAEREGGGASRRPGMRERRGSVREEGEIRDWRGKCRTAEGEIRQRRANE